MKQLVHCKKVVMLIFLAVIAACSNSGNPANPEGAIDPVDPSTNPSEEIKFRTIQIRDHLQECIGVSVRPCMLTRDATETDWSYFYDEIEGFEFEWGYSYELEISVLTVENPPADGSSLRYTLINTLSKTPVQAGTLFNYSSMYASETLNKKSDTLYSLYNYNVKDFTCDPSDCELLDSLLTQQKAFLFEFQHANKLSDPLILKNIVCSASVDSFRQSCLETEPGEIGKLTIDFTLLDKFAQISNSYNQGETITLAFNIANATSADVTIEFNSGQSFDIYVQSSDNVEVWRWSEDRVFTQALSTLVVDAMKSTQQTTTWDQLLSDGTLLEPGKYRAYGYLLGQTGRLEFSFTIQ